MTKQRELEDYYMAEGGKAEKCYHLWVFYFLSPSKD